MKAETRSSSNQAATYRIEFLGGCSPRRQTWFRELGLRLAAPGKPGATILEGKIADQSQLRGILSVLWDLNLEIILVQRLENSLDEGGR